MGSLTASPRVPERTVIVREAAPAAPPPEPDVPGAAADVAQTNETPEETVAARRTESLLRRSRGRFGTVLTGFRGLLAPKDTGAGRKTLLGE